MSEPGHAQTNRPLLAIEEAEGPRTFRLIGEMDLSNSCWVGSVLDRHAAGAGDLTLDCTGLVFLDAAGRAALARLAGKLGRDRRLVLRNPTPPVARLLSSSCVEPVANLIVDRSAGPDTGSPGAVTLQPGAGLPARMWGVLGLAQSLMPMADEVSFTVRRGERLTTPVATGADASACDSVQYELNDGPCVRAAHQGTTEVLTVTEAGAPLRPFVDAALDRGINAVLSIPVLREPSEPVGALNLYSRAPGAFPSVEIPHAQVLAIRASRLFSRAG